MNPIFERTVERVLDKRRQNRLTLIIGDWVKLSLKATAKEPLQGKLMKKGYLLKKGNKPHQKIQSMSLNTHSFRKC
mgnify:FL=1